MRDYLSNQSSLEKLLTIGALIGLVVDVWGLLGILVLLIEWQMVDGVGFRPSSSEIHLPNFLWDTQALDALTLIILLYSFGTISFVYYRYYIGLCEPRLSESTVYESLRYRSGWHRLPWSESLLYRLPRYVNGVQRNLIVPAFSAMFVVFGYFQIAFALWFQVFITHAEFQYFGLMLFSICIWIFRLFYIPIGVNQLALSVFKDIDRELFTDLFTFFTLPSISNYFDDVDGCFNGCLSIFFLPFWLLLIAVINFCRILLYMLQIDWTRTLRGTFGTAFLVSPLFIYIYRANGLDWGWSGLYTLGIFGLVVPLLWILFMWICVIFGNVLVFLFAPARYMETEITNR